MRLAPVLVVLGVCACGSFADSPGGTGGGGGDASSPDDPDGAGTTSEAGGSADGSPDAGLDLDAGLLAHWKLDETSGTTATDALGENPGERIGGTWATGRLGGAFSTGGSGYVKVPWTDKLNAPDRFTLTIWLNLDAKTDGDSFVFTHGSSFYVKLNGRKPQLTMGSGVNYNVTREVPPSEWHHLAIAFDAGVPAIYVDGILGGANLNTMPPTTRPLGGNDAISIGCGNGATNFSIGSIDDVRFYGRVLSVSEIKALAAGQ